MVYGLLQDLQGRGAGLRDLMLAVTEGLSTTTHATSERHLHGLLPVSREHTVVSLYGLFAAVFAPAPALPVAVGAWPGTAAAAAVMDGSAAGLRRLAAGGLLLTAAASHGLFDFAGSVKQQGPIDVAQAVKKMVVM